MKRIAAALFAATLMGGFFFADRLSATPSQMTINATGGLDQTVPTCDGGSAWAYFVINQIDDGQVPPSEIDVSFSDGTSSVENLLTLDGKAAKYQGPVPAGASVVGATAVIYDGWSGEFNLSHYFCGDTTTTTTTTTSTTSSTSTTSTTEQPTTTTTDETTTTTEQPTTTTIEEPTTTTIEEPTTTTTEEPTTTTTEEPTTTTTEQPTTTTTTAAPAQLGAGNSTSTTSAPAVVAAAPVTGGTGQLAFTGGRPILGVQIALGLLALGGALLFAARRLRS